MVGAYSVVFKFLLGTPIPNFALFLFLGLAVWAFFYGGAQIASGSLVANAGLVTKVSFPRQIVPLASMTGNALHGRGDVRDRDTPLPDPDRRGRSRPS